jgi:hypothetical protein
VRGVSTALDTGRHNEASNSHPLRPIPYDGCEMANVAGERLKRIGVIGLIACACMVYLRERPAIVQLEASSAGGFRALASLVDAQFAVHPTTADFRAERSLFGMETEPVVGKLAAKWRSVQLEIDREEKVLADCRFQKPCPEPARDLLNIVAEAGDHTGRARIGLINRAVDLAITPTSDEVQWGRGRCEDRDLAKLLSKGVPRSRCSTPE